MSFNKSSASFLVKKFSCSTLATRSFKASTFSLSMTGGGDGLLVIASVFVCMQVLYRSIILSRSRLERSPLFNLPDTSAQSDKYFESVFLKPRLGTSIPDPSFFARYWPSQEF